MLTSLQQEWKSLCVRFRVRYNQVRMARLGYATHILIHTSPDKICDNYLKQVPDERSLDHILTIAAGDWDLRTEPFAEGLSPLNRTADVLAAFRARILEGCAWEDTAYFERLRQQIDAGQAVYGCRNSTDLRVRFDRLDSIWRDIAHNGYRKDAAEFSADQIRVHIGRHGALLFCDGRHRLSIAKVLNLSFVPVIVCRRHTHWAEDLRAGRSPADHPDAIAAVLSVYHKVDA